MSIERDVRVETRELARPFRTAAVTRTSVELLVVALRAEGHVGVGESFVHERSGWTLAEAVARAQGADLNAIDALEPSPASDALDAALWDLRCKREGKRIGELLGRELAPVRTLMTVGADALESLEERAASLTRFSTLKIKAGPSDALQRVDAVRRGHPAARLVVDGNESWRAEDFSRLAPRMADRGVALIEQPLRAGEDAALATLERPVPVCADESFRLDVDAVRDRYDAVNLKLTKTGGLTRALALEGAVRESGMMLFVGCMVSTSRALAPAMVVAQRADFVDLDGALHLASDVPHGLRYEGEWLHPPTRALWG